MNEPAKDEYGNDAGNFREYVLGVVSDRGLRVSSLRQEEDGSISIMAEREDSLIDSKVLVYAHHPESEIENIDSILAAKKEHAVEDALLLCVRPLPEDLFELCSSRGVQVVDLTDKAGASGADTAEPIIYEQVFADGFGLEAARKRFEKDERKSLMGLGRKVETLKSVHGRYAPVACFKLRKVPAVLESHGRKVVEAENRIWVNMSDCNLYYLYMGVAGKGAGLRSTNILRRLADVPEVAVRIFSQIVEEGVLDVELADPGFRDIIHSNASALVMLENLDLVSSEGSKLFSNVKLPAFEEKRYDISRNIGSDSSFESTYPADELAYPIPGMLDLLKNLFNAQGSFVGVTYMPYYVGTYASEDERVRVASFAAVRFQDG